MPAKAIRRDRWLRLKDRFEDLLKTIGGLAAKLNRNKEIRDLFTGLMEEVIPLLSKMDLDAGELLLFFGRLLDVLQTPAAQALSSSVPLLARYLRAGATIISIMFHRRKGSRYM